MKLKPYPDYKESFVGWLGEIPSHWDLMPTWSVLTRKKELVGSKWSNYDLLSLTKQGIILRDISSGKGKFPESFDLYQKVNPGDLVFCLFDVEETPRTVGLSPALGMVTGAYTRMIVDHNHALPEYLEYYFIAIDDEKRMRPLYSGLRNVIPVDSFMQARIGLPSIKEQQSITAFLDRETAEIDAFIAEAERLIELLNERRTAAITQAVTKGLDPHAPMKDSGIEWLGEVPEHWEMVPTWSVFRRRKELVGDTWADYQLLSLTGRGIIERDIESAEGKFPEHFDGYQIVEPGDFVFCLFDVEETPRTVGLSNKYGMITSAYTRFLIAREDVNPSFLEMYYIALDNEKRLKPLYSGLRNVIQTSAFLQARIPMPPQEEQNAIVDHLMAQNQNTDKAIATAREGIALARERRQALISAAVTGKIDVRSAL